jgi:hypothetical protein
MQFQPNPCLLNTNGIPYSQDREEWEAFWRVQKMDAGGKIFPTMRYYVQRAFDWPATFVREKIVEPINDKYRLPYYQRKFTRVPDIDQCGVMDRASYSL